MENLAGIDHSKRAENPPPNLVKTSAVTSQSSKRVIVKGVKCRCGKAWCPVCGKKTAIKRFVERIKDWNWKFVRQLILTVDPNLYPDPESALKAISNEKHIANAMRNLERTLGIIILDYAWILEWHRNQYPHWHLFVLTDKPGRAGMIGGDNARRYWKSGRVTESYIRNETHWGKITGYFAKHGYFNRKKAHQSRLPEWARNKHYVIRRSGSKAAKKEGEGKKLIQKTEQANDFVKLLKYFEKKGEELFLLKKTVGEQIDACGCETDIYLGTGFFNLIGKAQLSYKEFISMPGEYIEGQGYIVNMSYDEFKGFTAKYIYLTDS